MYFTGTYSLFTGTGTTDSAERSLCHLGLHMPPFVFHLATSFIPWTTRTPRSCNDAQMYAKVRWDDNGLNSFADTRQVGLGGGIE